MSHKPTCTFLVKIEIVNDVLIRCQEIMSVTTLMYKLKQCCSNPFHEGSNASVDARVKRVSASDPPTNDSDLDPLAFNQRQQRTTTVTLRRKTHRDRLFHFKLEKT